eukprot:TRINITY_DN593_c0_g1_i5.p1 TRINITY_DN593_c0_g1~~TRINITY_DN593_c0_g1_i5.p1  ORF type:complete len:633 (+),score=138.05 TRINITY_DN593_c0_g1_i5:176-1900(+)
MGKQCVEVQKTAKISYISEVLCNGCGICTKKCPFDAIKLVRLPKSLEHETTHRYGPNGFKLHKMPLPRRGQVLGFLGENGCGKSTACKILAGATKPNLGRFQEPPSWEEIMKYFRGSSLQKFFQKQVEGGLKVKVKPQHFNLTKFHDGAVKDMFSKIPNCDEQIKDALIKDLGIEYLLDRDTDCLSGGESQRVALCLVCLEDMDLYIFDEPCAYLDIKQRLRAAAVIRDIVDKNREASVVVVEHDISVLDFICDYVCLFYGTGSAYGVCTQPFGVREGVNMFLEGYIRSENMRFRPDSLIFNGFDCDAPDFSKVKDSYSYVDYVHKLGDFQLSVKAGQFCRSQVTVLLGENGTGKTTFIKLLKGMLGNGSILQDSATLKMSYKPQAIPISNNQVTVRDCLEKQIGSAWLAPNFNSEIIKPLNILPLLDLQLKDLSGGEIQRVAITICLGKDADLYLLDEPSTFLDVEQRIKLTKVIKRFIRNNKKIGFIVEHDLNMAAYIADQFIVFDGETGRNCTAHIPEDWNTGLSHFLQNLDLSMRKDPVSGRPRVNKPGSLRDREQKMTGNYITDEHRYL